LRRFFASETLARKGVDDGRLAIPATILHAKTLAHELRQFRAKFTGAGRETLEAD
jgi:hypothetical protein